LAGVTPAGIAVASVSDVRFGWTVGAGVEGKITNNWSAKLEYLYMDFDSFRAGTFTLAPGSLISANVDTRFHDHVPACRPELRFRRPGDREVLISALSSSRRIKSPGIARGLFVVQARKGLRCVAIPLRRCRGWSGESGLR